METTPENQPVMFRTSELDDRYGIKKSARNVRLGYLRMKSYQRGKYTYVDEHQLTILDAYNEHLNTHGSSDGFPIPEPSGPWGEDEPEETATAIAVSQPTQTVRVENPQQLQQGRARQFNPEFEDINQLVANAENQAVGVLMAERILANEFINNPSALRPELQEQLRQVTRSEATDPLTFAASLLSSMRNGAA
ncbi:MAG TPA: hypothetical protein V6D12_13655 [Candidatus Obscuribacterales bacterium]